jgi:hypothetical protein
MKNKSYEYNKKEAIFKFIFLKFVEFIFLPAMVVFLPYLIGTLTFARVNFCKFTSYNDIESWGCGLLTIIISIGAILVLSIIIILIYFLVSGIIKQNWGWAKKWSRTREQRMKDVINTEKKLRKKRGFLVGDTVRIKKNLKATKDRDVYGLNVKKAMIKYRGSITSIDDSDDDYGYDFRLKIDGHQWWWTAKMLELVKERENPDLKKIQNKK